MLNEQDRPPVSKPLDSILNGYIAGDGFLNKNGTLTVEQGKDQLNFVEWMFKKLKPFCTSTREIVGVYKTNKETKQKELRSYRFNTRAWFKDYHKNWYQLQELAQGHTPSFVKKLPVDIDKMFTPLFITVWFACDGTKTIGSQGAKIDVTAYTVEERKVLKDLFFTKYQISAKINSQGLSKKNTEQWALCILASDYSKFYNLITQDSLIPTLFPNKLCKKP